MIRPGRLAVFTFLVCAALPALSGEPEEEASEELAPPFREWLDEMSLLISEEEREYFLGLRENYHRNAFIEAFWAARDPFDDTHMNELRVHYEERVDKALSVLADWETLEDARAQTLVLHGEPYQRCWHRTREIEVWTYDEAPEDAKLKSYDSLYPVLLYQPIGSDHYKRWLPFGAPVKANQSIVTPIELHAVQRSRFPDVPLADWCKDAHVGGAMKIITLRVEQFRDPDPTTYETLEIAEPSKEWLATFHSRTTILPEDAATFSADLGFAFPGHHQQRTVVQGLIEVERGELAARSGEKPGEPDFHQLLVLGEVVRGDELFETFRYRFEVPVRAPDAWKEAESTPVLQEPVALVFQRYLRPGPFRLVVKVEDLFGRRFVHFDRAIEVPDVDRKASSEILAVVREESELYRALAEADAATARGEHMLQLLSPPGVVMTGLVRFQTVAVGDYVRVVFLLDEQPIFAKRMPPYSVELDLGDVPSPHRLRVNGYGAAGEVLATDEILMNPGGQRFRVSLTEPQQGRRYRDSLRAAVQVAVPDGEELERVELFLNETRVATLYQPPFAQPVLLGDEALAYVRAVGYLTDGNSSEDIVFINAEGEIDEIDVQFVELYATVHDRQGRFIPGLVEDDFKVVEDGKRQRARRFEWVENLPLHVALAIDVSASMEDSIDEVARAARTFVEEVVEARDRATLLAFNHQPDVRLRFTNDVPALTRELEALRTGGGTALYDSLAFALHYFHGIRGQRALLLLSDGEDESSGFDFDDALEFARRAGVQIYVVGLKEAVSKQGARKVLRKFAEETGGRAFFVEDLSGLGAIYAEIQAELRSQYLFAYQSTSAKDPSEFRSINVTVEVDGKKAEVRTMSGYYP